MRLGEDIRVAGMVFRRDLRRLLRHPLALVIMVGLCLMPSIYAWYIIAANWNPYGNAGALKVAVVNDDRGAENPLVGHLDVGDEVIKALHDNHQLGWTFVSKEEAMEGVESGEFYAAYVLPPDFSEDFLSVLSGDFVRPQLDYYVNEKISAVAPEFTNTAASTIESEIDETFVQVVSDTVVTMSQQVGTEVKGGADEAEGSLLQGVADAKGVIDSTRSSVEELDDSYDSAKTAVDGARQGFQGIDDALPGLVSDLDQASSDLKGLRSALTDYGTQVNGSLADASLALGQAAAKAEVASGQATAALTKAEGVVDSALASAQHLVSQNQTVIDQLKAAEADHPGLTPVIQRLEQENAELGSTVSALQGLQGTVEGAVSDAETAAGDVDSLAEQASQQLGDAASTLQRTTLPSLTASLDAFAEAIGTLRGACVALGPAIEDTISILDLLDTALDQAQVATASADTALGTIQEGLEQALSDLQALNASTSMEDLSTYLGLDSTEIGQFMAKPVEIKTVAEYPVANYGSGVAPFYTSLALWVSGFILTSVIRIRVDPEGLPPLNVTQAYLGRWLLFMVLALIQGLIACVGDLVLGIQCVDPVAYVFAGLVTVFVDVNILYALVFTMRHLGRALGVVLIIIQIPGSSGEYPVEMLPGFFQAIHPLLPFTYSIDAMREAIGGFYDGVYWLSLLALLPFLGIALLIGLVGGRYAFNLNALFDDELSATDLFVSEEPGAERQRFRLRNIVQSLLNIDAYRQWVDERVARFHDVYPWLLRVGWIAIFALPVLTLMLGFAAAADENTKAMLLALMIVGIILVTVYLIVVEFIERGLRSQQALALLDATDVRDQLASAQARADGSLRTVAPPTLEIDGDEDRTATRPDALDEDFPTLAGTSIDIDGVDGDAVDAELDGRSELDDTRDLAPATHLAASDPKDDRLQAAADVGARASDAGDDAGSPSPQGDRAEGGGDDA